MPKRSPNGRAGSAFRTLPSPGPARSRNRAFRSAPGWRATNSSSRMPLASAPTSSPPPITLTIRPRRSCSASCAAAAPAGLPAWRRPARAFGLDACAPFVAVQQSRIDRMLRGEAHPFADRSLKQRSGLRRHANARARAACLRKKGSAARPCFGLAAAPRGRRRPSPRGLAPSPKRCRPNARQGSTAPIFRASRRSLKKFSCASSHARSFRSSALPARSRSATLWPTHWRAAAAPARTARSARAAPCRRALRASAPFSRTLRRRRAKAQPRPCADHPHRKTATAGRSRAARTSSRDTHSAAP